MRKKKQKIYRNLFRILEYLLHRQGIRENDQDDFTMEKPFIGKLQNEVNYRGDTCYAIKILKYVVMDNAGNILSVCEECRERILEESD